MMANNIQIGMMGDYPLMVNGATGQATKNETQLIAIIAYNAYGGGNGIVVHKDSPFYELADLKGKNVSVPFGSAAHGMMLTSLQKRGLPPDFWNWCRNRRKSAAPICRKSASTRMATSCRSPNCCRSRALPARSMTAPRPRCRHSTASSCARISAKNIRRSWSAYIKALMEANDWMRKNPKLAAEKIEEWTKINKEVVYIFLGPGGVHTLDPTIKPRWIESVGANYAILQKLNMIKELNVGAWVNDSYVRQAYKEQGLDYDKQLASFDTIMSPAPIRSATRRSTILRKPERSGSRAATSCRSVRRSARCRA